MMHPLAGVFLVTEANYRRERAIANFGPFRRNRHDELDSVHQPAVHLPRQRTTSSSREGTAAQHQHAA